MPVIDHEDAGRAAEPGGVRSRLPAFLALGFVAMLSLAPNVAAGGIAIADFQFDPPKLTVSQGSSLLWANSGPSTHSVTSDKSDSGHGQFTFWTRHDFAPGTNFRISFPAAGTFFYHCSFHTFMHGLVKVPLTVGNQGLAVTITTASVDQAPTSAFRYVIEWRQGDSSAWHRIQTRFKVVHLTLPHAGSYQFVAAVKQRANGAMSGWSKIVNLVTLG